MKDYNSSQCKVGADGETLASGILTSTGYTYTHYADLEHQTSGIDGVLSKDGVNLMIDVKSDRNIGLSDNVLFELFEQWHTGIRPGWYYYSKADGIVFINQLTSQIFYLDLAVRDVVDDILADVEKYPNTFIARAKGEDGQTMVNLIVPKYFIDRYIQRLN